MGDLILEDRKHFNTDKLKPGQQVVIKDKFGYPIREGGNY